MILHLLYERVECNPSMIRVVSKSCWMIFKIFKNVELIKIKRIIYNIGNVNKNSVIETFVIYENYPNLSIPCFNFKK